MESWTYLSSLPGFEPYTRHAVGQDGRFLTKSRSRNCITRPRSLDADGHVQVRLEAESSKTRVRLSALIALAFLEPRPSLAHFLEHRDGDEMNCAAENLFWQSDPDLNLNAIWKPIDGFPGYDISDEGQVTSTSQFLQRRQLIKVYSMGAHGDRAYVQLRRPDNGMRTGMPLANLMARHFLLSPPNNARFLWFRDGDTFNCRADNLYWTDRVELHLLMVDAVTGEEWRTLSDWPDYHISSYGRMRRSVMTNLMDSGARMEKEYTYRVKDRYVAVNLTRGKKKSQVMLHHLVCETFHGPAPSAKHIVWFKDGNGLNCRANNLCWLTSAEASALTDAEQGAEDEWRPIPRYDGYEVSTDGRVRHQERAQRRIREGHVLQAVPNKKGKMTVSLRVSDHSVPMLVHSLVAAAFLPPPPSAYAYIVHKDKDEANCRPENLEWITSRQAYTKRYKEASNSELP